MGSPVLRLYAGVLACLSQAPVIRRDTTTYQHPQHGQHFKRAPVRREPYVPPSSLKQREREPSVKVLPELMVPLFPLLHSVTPPRIFSTMHTHAPIFFYSTRYFTAYLLVQCSRGFVYGCSQCFLLTPVAFC